MVNRFNVDRRTKFRGDIGRTVVAISL